MQREKQRPEVTTHPSLTAFLITGAPAPQKKAKKNHQSASTDQLHHFVHRHTQTPFETHSKVIIFISFEAKTSYPREMFFYECMWPLSYFRCWIVDHFKDFVFFLSFFSNRKIFLTLHSRAWSGRSLNGRIACLHPTMQLRTNTSM